MRYSVLALLETTTLAFGLAGPILVALVGFTIFAAEVWLGSETLAVFTRAACGFPHSTGAQSQLPCAQI